ncbi:DUF2142 domain-containing protein [Methanobacterium sp. BAmetb5]|uniref:DUF2142 domain-containing protein n=1 Tax=Methanobacterium sp. BAmetb5 TaxID=2025351 RepID=UPI000E978ECA|nr:DUF2142 domain-containing protein [Methanobacterium sp. BAmetb5]AXV39242.1 MAG: hypothetical protein CIT02_02355 [Methanobacterium sp. BAmetb5]
MINIINKAKPEKIFLIIAVVYGLIFLIFTPFMVPDEGPHFYKTLDISDGHLKITKVGEGAGIYVPESVIVTFNNFSINSLSPELYLPFNSNDRVFYDISGIAIASYSPLPYLASAIAISIGKLFNFSPIILLYMGRLANLLLWIFLCYLAIKMTPIHKWVFLLISLMPMALFEASSLSADSFTMGIVLLTVAFFFKLSLDNNEITAKDKYILLALVSLVSLTKPTYFIIIFLFFMIPKNKFKNGRERFFNIFLIFAVGSLLILTWSAINSGLYIPSHVPGVSTTEQISIIIHNPFNYLTIVLQSYLYNINLHLTMLIGNFSIGALENPLPLWLVCIYTLFLMAVPLLDKNKINVTIEQKSISLITFFITLAITTTLIYITWNKVGVNYILGIQSRYFIPVMPLLLLIFYNKKLNHEFKYLKLIIILFIIISLTISIFLIVYG